MEELASYSFSYKSGLLHIICFKIKIEDYNYKIKMKLKLNYWKQLLKSSFFKNWCLYWNFAGRCYVVYIGCVDFKVFRLILQCVPCSLRSAWHTFCVSVCITPEL